MRTIAVRVQTTPDVHVRGRAREALTCYRSVFGGDIALATYADIQAVEDPAQAEQIASGRVTARNGFDIMAHDTQAILVPLAPAPFAPLCEMLTDRFGVTRIIGVLFGSEG